jgi:hypothetical protein
MKRLLPYLVLLSLVLTACVPIPPSLPAVSAPAPTPAGVTIAIATAKPAEAGGEREAQLKKLQALLQSPDFALEMASWLDAAYYKGQGQTPPPFLTAEEETKTADKSAKEEKIAINLAGFYALEAAIGMLSEKTKETPSAILDSIVKGTRSEADMLLISRFANATWKAGQPFRALNRITRDTFRPAALLSNDERKKDFVQIQAAAEKLQEKMQPVKDQPRDEQLKALQKLLQSPDFALEMASWLDAAYYKGQGQTPPPFLTAEEQTKVTAKPVREEKIAINLAGLYAVEAGIGVLSERTGETPIAILQSIADGKRSNEDMLLLARFANATWKAGQPFRSLSRITRDTFRPAALLSEEELKKDFEQIQAASAKLLEAMKR